MTNSTNSAVREFHIEIKLRNTGVVFKPQKRASAKAICHCNNGDIYNNGLLGFNPVQTNVNSTDTPVYAVLENGEKLPMDAPTFWSALGNTELFRVLVNLDMDELGELFDEDRDERIRWIRLVVPANKFVESFEIISEGTINKKGRKRTELRFVDPNNIVYVPAGENYGLNHPTFKGLPEIKAPTKPVDRLVNTTVAAKAAASVTPDVEVIVVDNSNPSCDDLENELFAASHAKPPAPVGDFSNADLEREATSKKKSNKMW